MSRELVTKAKRVVIKIGTRVITQRDNILDKGVIERIVLEISKNYIGDRNFIIVSSGAIALGLSALGINKRPGKINILQAAASIGQSKLMHIYEEKFKSNNIGIAQLLLTYEDIQNRHRYINIRNTIFALWSYRIIPVVNENDAVSFAEIRFGDNDLLAAHLGNMIDADLLIILTDTAGLYNKNPNKYSNAEIQKNISHIDDRIRAMAMGKGSSFSSGGMESKINAAEIATKGGVGVIITDGKNFNLSGILNGEEIGTFFVPKSRKIKGRKKWIAFNPKINGKIVIDKGGVRAIVDEKKSLLAVGIKDVIGNFKIGDNVSIVDEEGKEIAKGLTNFSSEDIKKIKGVNSRQIPKILGTEIYFEEIVHRDNLVVLI